MSKSFNHSQIQAISHAEGPCLVLAGPGSGKTTVITERTWQLVEKQKVDPSQILVITFTKAAALEMKQRFIQRMGGRKVPVTFGTFHAIYFHILKYAYHFQSSNIISEEKKYQFMRDIISKHRLEYDDESEFILNLLSEISTVKTTRMDIRNYYSSHCGEEIFRFIFEEYKTYMHRNKLIDFDDMLLYTYELFQQRKDILSAWQKKYTYILVDEFQDIDQLQYDILRMLALPENNLFIVGDDDQSIYRFRGSKPEIMLNFHKDFPNAKQILLDTNYRCQNNIVKASLNLIGYNKNRYQKDIKSNNKESFPVRILQFEDQRQENLYIIKEILEKMNEGSCYQDFAILFRTNTQPRLLMEQLMEYNIPFKTRDKIPNLYEHWITRDLFTYIRIAHGSNERKDFFQIMNRPKRYLGRDSLQDPIVNMQEWKSFYAKQPWIVERIDRMEYDFTMLSEMRPYAAINYIRKGIGYEDFLKEYAVYRHMNEEDLLDVLEELHTISRGFDSFEQWNKHIGEYTAEIRKLFEQKQENSESVTLMTLHSSKGLEFKDVYIIDANEGIMPYKKAALEADIEEERRMFYVGMTRAKENLTLCSIKNMNNKTLESSRFIEECKSSRK